MDHGKVGIEDYLYAAKALGRSMSRQKFRREYPIPIDKFGNIMGGAHRLAAAIVVGCDAWVELRPGQAWAPAWGRQWFTDNGMADADLDRLQADWDELCRKRGYQE